MPSRTVLGAVLPLSLVLLFPAFALLAPPPPRPVVLAARNQSGALHLNWVRELPPLEPAWPDQPRFTSDAAYRPVVLGSLVLVASSRTDDLTALDGVTGKVRWRFSTDGPIRFAPAVHEDRVYVASDDGHLYCLDSEGRLQWKFRGGPAARPILGNERLISSWPARGAPVVAGEGEDATVYFAAGIWPFMGIFLHALDANTGAVRWTNSGDGATFIKQPHNTDAFAGVAPQGQLVVAGDYLLVAGGRSIPACYDRRNGKRLHYRLGENSKLGGGPDVVVAGDVYVNGGGAFDLATGRYLGTISEPVATDGPILYSASGSACRAFDVSARPAPEPATTRGKGNAIARLLRFGEGWLGNAGASVPIPRARTLLLHAGNRLYGGGDGVVFALDLPLVKGKPALVWQAPIEGTARHLAANEERLFVSTREGRLYTFGPKRMTPRRYRFEKTPLRTAEQAQKLLVRKILQTTGVREGYGVVVGIGTGGLISELLANTDLRLIVLDKEQRIATFRRALHGAGLDGKRISVLPLHGSPIDLPPYLCNLVVSENLAVTGIEANEAFFDRVFRSLRPYGGVACLPLAMHQRLALKRWLAENSSEGQARLTEKDGLLLLARPGALRGSANWTHEHGDAANTRVSRDTLVQAPLGVLWFGGPGHQGILPRHGHGPVPQVADGRLFIEGVDGLRALDVYTGRLLWEARLPGLGKLYASTAHQAGANAAGSNYVSTSHGVYVASGKECLRLDPATGRTWQRFTLPPLPREKDSPTWNWLSVSGPYLIGGANKAQSTGKKVKGAIPGTECSLRLTVLDRANGRVLFHAHARGGFRHNAICIGNGRLYAIDRPPIGQLSRRSKANKLDLRLLAFDMASGKVIWSKQAGVFGTWLSYSEEQDVLVEAGLMSRDTLWDEAAGMRAYQGTDGRVLWQNMGYFGPALIHGDRILKGGDARAGSGTACELRTGKPILEPDPLTGNPIEWKWVRTYGCNTPAASQHLILFRSGAAGYCDVRKGGTGNLGGFRSSCTLNLVAAGGVLTAPDLTRTCTCSYQQQTSLALIHMPEAETWTFTTARKIDKPIRQLGLLLGAPGTWKADNGTLWLEHPPAGGPSPRLPITTAPARLDTFRMHKSQVVGDGPKQVAASGVRRLRQLTIPLVPSAAVPRVYTVRMYFLEPDRLSPGQRCFDVAVQGTVAFRRLDVSKEAGGPGRLLVRQLAGVRVRRDLTITLTPAADAPVPVSVLCGVEVLAEGW
jgi:outer membrane protein assembly factor BamB